MQNLKTNYAPIFEEIKRRRLKYYIIKMQNDEVAFNIASRFSRYGTKMIIITFGPFFVDPINLKRVTYFKNQ